MQYVTPEQLMAHMESTGAFETEEFGFAQECAMQFGFDYTDDDATQFKCSAKQLFCLMKALGYHRVARVVPAVAAQADVCQPRWPYTELVFKPLK